MIAGKHVDLVPVERAHLPLFAKWLNDPDVTRFLNWYLPINVDGEEKWFNGLVGNHKEINFTIVLKVAAERAGGGSDPPPIGNCAIRIDWKNRVGNVGIMVGEKGHWGKGFGTEAMDMLVTYGFNTLDMQRIELETFDFNERARRSYAKLGFKEEGRRRKAHFVDGQYVDVVFMGILQDEWRQRQVRPKA